MMQILKGMWAGLDNTGRIVLIVSVSLLAIAGIAAGVDIGPWLADLLGVQ